MKRLILFILLIASFDAFGAPPPISTFPLTVTQATPHAVGPTGYTDGIITDAMSAMTIKPWCRALSTGNLSLSGIPSTANADGIGLVAGDLILLGQNQTTGSERGPWIVSSGAWSRPDWYASGHTTQASLNIGVLIRAGTQFAGSWWRITTTGTITIDATSTAWARTAILPTPTPTPFPTATPYPTTTPFPSATPYPTPTPFNATAVAAHTVFGNFTGSSAIPTFNALSTNLDAFFTTASAGNLRAAIASNAVTGSAGNLVFSISPAITGTMTTQAITAGGLVDVTAGGFRAAGNGLGFGAGAGVELVYSEPRGYLQTYLRPSGPYKQFAIEGVATMLNPNSGGTAGAGGFGPTNTPLNVFHIVGSPANNTAIGLATTAPNLRIGSTSLANYWDIGRENATTGDFLFNDATTEAARITTSTRRLGVGTGATVSAKVHVISTTEQLRLGFDPSNGLSIIANSSGNVTFDAFGSSPDIRFNDAIGIPNIPSGSPTPVPIAGYGKLYLTDGNLKYISPVDGPGGPHVSTLANQ